MLYSEAMSSRTLRLNVSVVPVKGRYQGATGVTVGSRIAADGNAWRQGLNISPSFSLIRHGFGPGDSREGMRVRRGGRKVAW